MHLSQQVRAVHQVGHESGHQKGLANWHGGFQGKAQNLLWGRSTGEMSYLKAELGVIIVAGMVACEYVFIISPGSFTMKLSW